jgi:hypothetical protein
MVLQIQRQRRGEFAFTPERQVLRQPAGLRRRAARFVQRMQEREGKKGIGILLRADQAIPGRLADFRQRRNDAGLEFQLRPRWKSGAASAMSACGAFCAMREGGRMRAYFRQNCRTALRTGSSRIIRYANV